jgi:predicted O-methyltransferase YrrM
MALQLQITFDRFFISCLALSPTRHQEDSLTPTEPSKHSSARPRLREFNPYFLNHPQLRAVILPVGDGLG